MTVVLKLRASGAHAAEYTKITYFSELRYASLDFSLNSVTNIIVFIWNFVTFLIFVFCNKVQINQALYIINFI